MTAQERHCPLLECGESEGHIQEEGSSLTCTCTRFNYCSLAESTCLWKYNWDRSVGTLFLCKNEYEDAVGPATSSQGFSVLVDAGSQCLGVEDLN